MSGHTIGNWKACDPGDYDDFDGRSVVILGGYKRLAVVQNDDAEAIANARLIAAAPDLLKALREAQSVLNVLRAPDMSVSAVHVYARIVEAETKARTAIAKATGES